MVARLTAVGIGIALGLSLAASASAARLHRYYLSLGDSLAQGMQPDPAGITVNTDQGYADQLYELERAQIHDLVLVKLGCGGESTSSMLTGRGNPDAIILGCNPSGGSQMAAAERFLRKHHRRREVAFVTLDIGANDVDGCAPQNKIDVGCVVKGVEHIHANLPIIMRRLHKAAAPGTPMASMTLYDPFLQLYLTPGDQTEALDINSYAHNFNRALERLYRESRFSIAHVDDAFKTYELSPLASFDGQMVPPAVAEVCKLTWMCAPEPVGPNIHANKAGYGVIARAFARAFGRVH